ncbi:acetoin utilization deacetylase AcuC-like enzyme [Roseibium hamelinense]|uniref:Acetoin utilization deacetylase AcuC-like enzyme n=1 Tax=Roseibium hamelinense TaxID=150831 RepID=A0A562SI01_9HYPH|nr:histone deacetylase family protein [Roseibium hamelinense]MTI43927.1 histone deacetylase family protein [Roseibium hamelinense]TWI80778.1 acetoin utilization deacetylase AcuC-like enzyme [Roseibium hamelinense]
MKTVFSDLQLSHSPKHEISDGELKPAVEIPSRAEIVLKTVQERGVGDVVSPETFGARPVRRIHAPDYVDFLESFWGHWSGAGRKGEAFPFVWPIRSLRPDPAPAHIDGLLGRYSMDAGTPIGEHTYSAATASAHTALTAAKLVHEGERSAFGLCRPPGHHAGIDFFGGYCFFNNAAIAAQWLRDHGATRVAILDVDYHHGNGTQAIFYERSDILFLSIHADPTQEYPYFLGHADETGEHAGTGFTRNWPLPIGTTWEKYSEVLDDASRWLLVYRPDYLIVSLGLDCFEHDPISGFRFKSDDFFWLGQRLSYVGVPTVFLMEGGYAVDALGTNCVNVLEGFEGG